ncbi:hypothetical protein [Cytobacillus praedii]|nr:hypothetical protein [Cytobacillus praedii]
MGVKEFSISGKLIAPENLTHEEMINILFELHKSKGLFFIGETR